LVLKNYVLGRVFPLAGVSSGSCFLAEVGFLRDCHRGLRSYVEEPHQSFQVLCHGS
jgi:hypothetical protein